MARSNKPDEGDLKGILEGRAFIAFDTGIDRDALMTGSEPDTATLFLFRQKEAFNLLHFANLIDSNGNDIFVLDEPSFIQSVMAGHGFTADMQDKVFLGTISDATDFLDREFVENIPYPTPLP